MEASGRLNREMCPQVECQARNVSEHKNQNVIQEGPRDAVGCSVQNYDTRKIMKINFSSLVYENKENQQEPAAESLVYKYRKGPSWAVCFILAALSEHRLRSWALIGSESNFHVQMSGRA